MDFHKEDDDIIRSSRLQVFLKIDFPKKKSQYSQENACIGVSF